MGFPQRVCNEVGEFEFMESIDESRTVWQSIDNIVGMERSLDALWGAVADELDAIGTDAAMTFVEDEEDRSSSTTHDFDSGGWVYTGECRVYRLELNHGGDTPVLKGVASIRMELWRKAGERAEAAWRYAKTPLIYVAYHGNADSDPEDQGRYGQEGGKFGLDQYGNPYDKSEEDARYRARTPLWIYDEIPDAVDEWIKSSWFFAVPLVEISSYDELRAQITEPLRELLMENRPPEEVFRGRRAIPAGREMSRGHADDQRERNTV